MTWVAWRLQRNETLLVAAILALLAALLIPTGLTIAHAYSHDGLGACVAANGSAACADKVEAFQMRFGQLFNLTDWFTLLPGLIGIALAAPFVLDIENGTYRLAWTQSVTRLRWIAGRLAVPIACALVASGAYVALLTWWRVPYVHLNGRLDNGTYDSEGTVVFAYTLFALGLALAVGVVWRRAAAALTVSFLGYVPARVFVDSWLRFRLVAPLHATYALGPPRAGQLKLQPPASLRNAEIISQQIVGHPVIGGGKGTVAVPFGRVPVTVHAVYQPASHFWSLQLAETGLFAGAAVLLILFVVWWTHERIA